MKERKTWSNQEDKVLKHLIEERGITKWAQISDLMEKEYLIHGRNGKQCRERYHNHLDRNISNEEWKVEEENRLFEMQDEVGNKWALIASKLPGRSDNCVKNHFYSKLRKGLRKVNKKIHKFMKREYKDIKTAVLYKILETMETHNKSDDCTEEETVELCKKIRNALREYDDSNHSFQDQNDQLTYVRSIIEDLALFDKDIKKTVKRMNLKFSLKLESDTTSPTTRSNHLSTKSVYDEDESYTSNSDLFSSSSFDHQSWSLRSNRSPNKLKPGKMVHRSESIQSQSQSQRQSDEEILQSKLLYKSANSLVSIKNQLSLSKRLPNSPQSPNSPQTRQGKGLALTSSLSLKGQMIEICGQQEDIELKKEGSQSSKSSKSNKSNDRQHQNKLLFKYMMGEEQPFQMRLLPPRCISMKQQMEMNNEEDELFSGEGMQMEIEDDTLIHNFSGLCLNEIPKLGHSLDL